MYHLIVINNWKGLKPQRSYLSSFFSFATFVCDWFCILILCLDSLRRCEMRKLRFFALNYVHILVAISSILAYSFLLWCYIDLFSLQPCVFVDGILPWYFQLLSAMIMGFFVTVLYRSPGHTVACGIPRELSPLKNWSLGRAFCWLDRGQPGGFIIWLFFLHSLQVEVRRLRRTTILHSDHIASFLARS